MVRTRVCHPPDRSSYGPSLWSHVLRDQLQVDKATFWACVADGVLPARSTPPRERESLPAGLVSVLLHQAGVPEAGVAAMTKDEAIARVNEYWTRGN